MEKKRIDSGDAPSPARPAPSLREAQKDITRARITAAARDCFDRKGVADTLFEEVATAAGVGRATLYLHFANKNALLLALLAENLGAARAGYAALTRLKAPNLPSVRAWLAEYAETHRRHRRAMRLFQAAAAMEEPVRALIERHRQEVIGLLGAAFPAFDLNAGPDPARRYAAAMLLLARIDELVSVAVSEHPVFEVSAGLDLTAEELNAFLGG